MCLACSLFSPPSGLFLPAELALPLFELVRLRRVAIRVSHSTRPAAVAVAAKPSLTSSPARLRVLSLLRLSLAQSEDQEERLEYVGLFAKIFAEAPAVSKLYKQVRLRCMPGLIPACAPPLRECACALCGFE